MKKLMFLILFVLLVQISQAQRLIKASTAPTGTAFSNVYEVVPNGNIGIGVINPQQKLSVSNGMNIDQNSSNSGNLSNSLSFGNGSGEGIGSNRVGVPNQYGLDFYTNFKKRISITNGGNVAIGENIIPKEQLQIGDMWTFHNGGSKVISFNSYYDGQSKKIKNQYKSASIVFDEGGEIHFDLGGKGVTGNDGLYQSVRVLSIVNNLTDMGNTGGAYSERWGKVKIGDVSTNPSGYMLYVQKGILTEKVKVALKSSADWADYVFTNEYKLKKLSEVEDFIKENKHLPDMPSAQKLVDSGGIDVNEMFIKQMEKIEELTLYAIEQNKEIEHLKNEITKLKNKK